MKKIDQLLTQRLANKSPATKMSAMAKQSVEGNRSSFAGIFSVIDLSEQEKLFLEGVLNSYANDNSTLETDLATLISITSEIKAINHQAALLHGERIKKAQTMLTRYRDGAFTTWLIATYGNRQTPYNFLHYFEFCEALPKQMRLRIEAMPRQAIYTLASRSGDFNDKLKIIETYQGETKNQLLRKIREIFPLKEKDQRKGNLGENIIQTLSQALQDLERATLSKSQKNKIDQLLNDIQRVINSK